MDVLQRYELLLLAVPEITQDETKDLEKQINALIKDHKGATASFDRWGKYSLAYPVNHHDYGVYFLARFDAVEKEKLSSELVSLLRIRFDGVVMRSLLTLIDKNASSTNYKRPRSLEETPQEEVSSLLKNKRVEGLISAVESRRSPRKKDAHEKGSITADISDSEYADDMDTNEDM